MTYVLTNDNDDDIETNKCLKCGDIYLKYCDDPVPYCYVCVDEIYNRLDENFKNQRNKTS